MKLKGYTISHNTTKGLNNIIERIREMGIDMYNYYKCMPESLITFNDNYDIYNKGQTVIYISSKKQNIEYMHLLGFGFEGLVDDEDKIKEIESFGKYACIINPINCNINDEYMDIKSFTF